MTCYQVKRGAIGKASMYTGGCIFVDNAPGIVHIEHQITLSGIETAKSKLRLNGFAAEFVVKSIRFSGDGAAHQNGIAERNIKAICDKARVLMIHATIYSEEGIISEELWPMAMNHAAWLFIRIPKMESTYSSLELFSSSKIWPYDKYVIGVIPGAHQHTSSI
eukprot:12503961-Ditylum_brightwellii.AAC.1